MPNVLQVGNKEFWVAPIDSKGIGTPVRWNGLVSTETESETESEAIYRDDIVYDSLEGATSFKVTATLSHIPEVFAEKCLGWGKDVNGVWVENVNPKNDCAIMIRKTLLNGDTNEQSPKLDIFYQCTATPPKVESETDEDKPTVSEVEIEFTAKPSKYVFDDVSKGITHMTIQRTSTNATYFDGYSTAVLKPTFPSAVATASLEEGGDK